VTCKSARIQAYFQTTFVGPGLTDLVSLMVLMLVMLWSVQATAASAAQEFELQHFTQMVTAAEVFPDANAYGEVPAGSAGTPPVVEVLNNGKLVGYVFLNSDFVNSTGYSGKPIHQLISIDLDGVIQRVVLVEHH